MFAAAVPALSSLETVAPDRGKEGRLGDRLGRQLFASVVAAGLLIGGYEAQRALEPPGEVIRDELIYAGSDVARLAWSTPGKRVQQSVSRYFSNYPATVDPTGFPTYVTVTLHDLDPDVCRDAYRMADRIEGKVVIEIEGSGDMDCHDRTDITWRIMP